MIQVVCTGKGTHREMILRSFHFGRLLTANRRDPNAAIWWQPYDDWREGSPGKPLKADYTFGCRRCGRKTRMKVKTLRTALDGLRAAGDPTLDISQLPF